MSSRNDIIDGLDAANADYGLVYTEVLGWIDLGHARGNDIRHLMQRINAGEEAAGPNYEITYSQGMASKRITLEAGKFITWRIRKGRTYQERQSIALAMMMTLARRFEAYQQQFPFYMVTDSGFSGEDLVSDLLGFYRVMRLRNPFPFLRPVSKQEALKRWDYYGPIGSFKNRDFLPLLFPDPEKFRNAQPRKGVLPEFMKTIQPYRDFKSGNVLVSVDDGHYLKRFQPSSKSSDQDSLDEMDLTNEKG
ncbi:DUF4056 domain-containing protein [Candidatus Pantoea multigeneris]|uniref:DUF4056 domain-containing protein n=1 Tax=Candidatus Pantoea multigeneris TaxID=2608357 RepID=A0ABX0RAI5_9GAMM|nr:DUF4056 domain-containing protein [Pantoea multigeneris]NIF22371.1 DUF4056 domain-containing protein [Pantoea multigeneris]